MNAEEVIAHINMSRAIFGLSRLSPEEEATIREECEEE